MGGIFAALWFDGVLVPVYGRAIEIAAQDYGGVRVVGLLAEAA